MVELYILSNSLIINVLKDVGKGQSLNLLQVMLKIKVEKLKKYERYQK